MSQVNVEVVRSVYDAFESRDMESVLQHVGPDVRVLATDGLPWSGTYSGHDGFEEFIRNVEDHVRLSIETEELVDSGSSVAQIGRSIGEVHATGTHFDLREVHVWGLRDGKIVSFQNYIDTQAQRRALGLPDEEAPRDPNREMFWS
jgi:uncharacterized protein